MKTIQMPKYFDNAVSSWLTKLNQKMVKYYQENFPSLPAEVLSLDEGRKFIRVWKNTLGQDSRSSYCFIDKTNGDILMCASWKTPAKHARGNLFNSDDGLDCCGPHGIQYLKGPKHSW